MLNRHFPDTWQQRCPTAAGLARAGGEPNLLVFFSNFFSLSLSDAQSAPICTVAMLHVAPGLCLGAMR